MPWCPQCKNEYRPGVELCADCGSPLVDELNNLNVNKVELAELAEEEDAKKLVEFLNFSHISDVSSQYIEDSSTWKVSVTDSQLQDAVKLLKAFHTAEITEEEKSEEKQKQIASKSSTYVKKEDKYQDFKSSAMTFIPFGIAGLIFVLLNVFGVVNFIHGILQYSIITALFLGFTYIGITSWIKLKSIKQEISTEQDNTSKITAWMKEHVTEDILTAVTNPSKSEEFNYIYRTDRIKELLLSEFGDLDENFVDTLVEEFYTENFDQ